MGFDAWFYARLDFQDKGKRVEKKEMEYLGRASYDTLGKRAEMFTHALYNHYCAPPNFDFSNKDQQVNFFNLVEKSFDFNRWVNEVRQHYRSNNILITMGCDFQFENADDYFKSSDMLMEFYNENLGKDNNVELIYSTPSMYVDAVNKENIEWPTKYDDMFPYADSETSWWTGYFSSRANSKGYIRRASSNLHASNKLFSLASIDQMTSENTVSKMVDAKQAMLDVVGIVMHHDAVTGTAKQAVADDYNRRIFEGLGAVNPVYAGVIEDLAKSAGIKANEWSWCFRSNSTY